MSPDAVPTAIGPDVLPNPIPEPDPEPPKPDPAPEPSPVPPVPEPAPSICNTKPMSASGNFLPMGIQTFTDASIHKIISGDRNRLPLAGIFVDYLVKNFKLEDTRIKTIGLGKSDKAPEGGSIEVLIYPEGTTTAQMSNSLTSNPALASLGEGNSLLRSPNLPCLAPGGG